MRRLFIDTPVLAYALGGEHAQRPACRGVLEAAASGRLQLHASVEAVQEFLFHRMRVAERGEALAAARRVASLLVTHPFDDRVLAASLDLVEAGGVRGRDAVHAATALLAGFDAILSTDQAFAAVAGLTVVAPADAL